MYAVVRNGLVQRYLQEDQPFTLDGYQYPDNWLRIVPDYERHERGIYEVVTTRPEGTYPSKIYYDGVMQVTVDDNTKIVTQSIPYVAKDVAVVKTDMTNDANSTTGAMLSQTDWYVIRKADANIAIPESVTTLRTNIRNYNNTLCASIAAANTIPELVTILTNISWPKE